MRGKAMRRMICLHTWCDRQRTTGGLHMVGSILLKFVVLMAAGVPVVFCLIVITMSVFLEIGDWRLFLQVPQRLFSPMENPLFLAIPFFLLTGEIMNRAQLTDKIMDFADSLVGWARGGLAHTNIVASVFFAGITGSAVSDTVAIGGIMMPAMEKAGYSKDFAAAVTAASSVIGPIIPPSIPFLIYASVMKVSVAALFLGGILPGLLIALALMITSHILCKKYNFDPPKPFAGLRHLGISAVRALPALSMPVVILGGLLGGFFSPTGASAVAAVYATLIGFLYYRTLKLSDLPDIFILVARNSAMILFLIGSAQVFAWLVTYFNMVTMVTEMFLSVTQSPAVFLLIVNAILLVLGMFFDMSFSIIVVGPLMAPVAAALGIDPIHFALVMCVNLCIGLSTPPYGLCLFAICGVSKGLSFTRLGRTILPFIAAEIAALLIMTYCEFFTITLPRFFGYA